MLLRDLARAVAVGLAIDKAGDGPPVVLLHGGLAWPQMTWLAQDELTARWQLWTVHRAGYGNSDGVSDGEDYELDARLLAPELPEGTHVVGHSSGAVAALYLVAAAPEKIASVTAIEPPLYNIAPEAEELRAAHDEHWEKPVSDWVQWLRDYFAMTTSPAPADPVLEALEPNAKVWKGFKAFPWNATPPYDEVAAAPARKLVLSGGYLPEWEAVCDKVAEAIGAERDVITGAGHAVQQTGATFNERLETFMRGG